MGAPKSVSNVGSLDRSEMHAFLNGPISASNQQCTKIGYHGRREAMRMLKKHGPPRGIVATGTGKMNCYQCRMCGLWHLGHR